MFQNIYNNCVSFRCIVFCYVHIPNNNGFVHDFKSTLSTLINNESFIASLQKVLEINANK